MAASAGMILSSCNNVPFFSYRNFSANFIKHEYTISGIATAVFSSGILVASGGSVSIAFVAGRVIQGAVVCFLNHHFSNFGITVIKNSIGKIYSLFDDSIDSMVFYKASIDTIRATTCFKIIRVTLNIFATVFAFTSGIGSDSLYLLNLGLSLATLACGSFLLKMRRISEQVLTSYAYISQREVRKQIELVFKPRFSFSVPSFIMALIGNIPARVDANFQNILNQYFSDKKQVGNSGEWIRKAITSYRISLGYSSRERENFENEYSYMDGHAFKVIAVETIAQIISLTPPPCLFNRSSYPSIILKEHKHELEAIHKKYFRLSLPLQKEVIQKINREEGPEDLLANEVWNSIRLFSYDKVVNNNPIFNAAIQEIFSIRAY